MAPIGRADLVGLPDYVAGRKIPGAVVLSSNEVAYDPPVGVISAICEAARGVNRYPDMGSGALTRHLAAALGSTPDSQVTLAAVYQSIVQQATLLSYLDDFKLLGLFFLALLPLLLLVRPGKGGGPAAATH